MSDVVKKEHETTAALVSYAAGTATESERKEVEAMTKNDPDTAARLALATASRDALAEADAAERDDWSPGELGFRRLLRDIEREEAKARVSWTESVVVWRGVAAAAVVALGVVSLWRIDGGPLGGDGGYAPVTVGAEAGALAQITFSPSATEAEIRALLVETRAILVDGPSALGVYRVRFETSEERDAGVTRMKTAVVVESVSAE